VDSDNFHTRYMVWEVDVARMEEMAWNTVRIIVNTVTASPSSSYWLQKLQQPPMHSCVHTHDTVYLSALWTWIRCEICVRWPTLLLASAINSTELCSFGRGRSTIRILSVPVDS
jgi:hypothetical protein